VRLATLLLLASLAVAEDGRLLRATGADLESFDVAVRLDEVDRSSPKALAAAFAQLQKDQFELNRAFVERFRAHHLEILARYYVPGMVAKQKAVYGPARRGDVTCEVGDVEIVGTGATAILEWAHGERSRRIMLRMERRGDAWWIRSVHDRSPDGIWSKPRPLGAPPLRTPRSLPEAAEPDRTGPDETVKSLRADVLRLAVLGNRGRRALAAHFFDIAAAFYGQEAAARARDERAGVRDRPPVKSEILGPAPFVGGVRVGVSVTERVPGVTARRSAIAEAAFDLKETADGWRIVNEHTRPKPDVPLEPASSNFGLIFLVLSG